MHLNSRNRWFESWPLSLGASALLFLVMYGMVPYTFAYNTTTPISLFHMLWYFWSVMPDWQHGILVFPISAVLIAWKWKEYLRIPVRGDNGAWGLFLVAFLLYWVGYKGDIKPMAFFSIQILIAALIVWFLGWKMFKAMLFPWAFLVFAWPMPGLDGLIAFPLREFMSCVTYYFLNGIGVPTLRVGTAIVSAPDFVLGIQQGQRFQLDVADPCSGIHSLFALTMVTALYGYLTLNKTWQKIVLFLSAAPLAVFGNFIRMLMLTFGTILMGPKVAVGEPENPSFFHMMAGYAVFAAALLGMLVVAWLLEYDWKRANEAFKKWAMAPASEKDS